MTTPTTVPFSSLVAVDAINARGKTTDALDEIAAAIAAKGLIQPLAVRPADSGVTGKGAQRYEIIDGRRRYLALARLVKDKRLSRSEPVPVLIRDEDDAEALETSLMANTVRLPMHPIDQHEVFARLVVGPGDSPAGSRPPGLTAADIAARFGISERTVRQHLALGKLAPEVRHAWRKGRIDAETAKAFAVSHDQTRQAEVLSKLGGRAQAWSVRQELAPKRVRVDQSNELALIGEDAYLEAGGSIDEDLFDDARYVGDVALLEKLARDRLRAECERLKADGWAWAEIDEESGGSFGYWQCDHVLGEDQQEETDETDPFTAEQKARSGCLVSISWKGALDVKTGLIRPDGADEFTGDDAEDDDQTDLEDFTSDVAPSDSPAGSRPEGAWPEPDQDDGPRLSSALIESITTQQTIAAQRVLARDPGLALAALIATLSASVSYLYGGSPVHVSSDGYSAEKVRTLDRSRTFATGFDLCPIASIDALASTLAPLVAEALDLRAHHPDNDRRNTEALVARMRGDDYLAEMRSLFAPADYFARVPKALAIEALEEMHEGGHDVAMPSRADLAAMKKAELAAWAAEQAQACGWLPAMLRHPAYELITRQPAPSGRLAERESEGATKEPATKKRKGRAAA